MSTQANVVDQTNKITKYMWTVLIAGLLGWMLDGMDGNLYSLVIQPAMRELLGTSATAADIGFYGGINIMLYLVGWATGGIVFGMLADTVGRLRILTISILTFAFFTGLTGLSTEWWHVGVCRFFTGLGSGVEWPIGAALIAETWKDSKYRTRAAAFMMSGIALGFFAASLIYRFVGELGWRPVFFVGILPALLVFWIRKHLEEPDEFIRVKAKRQQIIANGNLSEEDKLYIENPLISIWRPKYRKHTIVAIVMSSAALIGFWSIGAWMPTILKELLISLNVPETEFVALIAYGSMAYNAGGFFGYAMWGFITDFMGRKATFAINLVGPLVVAPLTFQYVHTYPLFLIGIFFVGFTVMGFFGGCAVYLPELFPSRMRATAMAVTNNIARYLTAAGPFITGLLVAPLGSFANAATVVCGVYVIGVIALFFATETRGKSMPED